MYAITCPDRFYIIIILYIILEFICENLKIDFEQRLRSRPASGNFFLVFWPKTGLPTCLLLGEGEGLWSCFSEVYFDPNMYTILYVEAPWAQKHLTKSRSDTD